jgi:hypothetical protein
VGKCIVAPENLSDKRCGVGLPDRRIQMPYDPGVTDMDRTPRGDPNASWPDAERIAVPETKPYRNASHKAGAAGRGGFKSQELAELRLPTDWLERLERDGVTRETLARAGMFQGVEPSEGSASTKQLHSVDFAPGHAVFGEGEPGDRLHIVISGKVKIGRRSLNGHDTLLTIMGPSDIFGELSIFYPGRRTSSATTITEVRAVSMDRDRLRAWIADRPEIADQLCGCWPAGCAAPTTTWPT